MPDLLEEAKRLSEAATPGVWDISKRPPGWEVYKLGATQQESPAVGTTWTEADAEFIARARTLIPELVERVEQAEQSLVDLHESLFIGSERGLSKEALGKMATFAKDAALAAHQRESSG